MSGELANSGSDKLLNYLLRPTQTVNRPRAIYLGLLTATPTDTSTIATITEPTDASYKRVNVTSHFGAPADVSNVQTTKNSSEASFSFQTGGTQVTHAFLTGDDGGVLKFYAARAGNYTNTADGSPRAELQAQWTLSQSTYYSIKFRTFLPSDHTFEASGWQQRHCFFQIHQGSYANREIGFDGSNYYVNGIGLSATNIGSASSDKGVWVSWELIVYPHVTDGSGLFVVKKNNIPVYKDTVHNHQASGSAYVKFGIYHWDWLTYTSAQTSMTLYMDDISCVGGATKSFDAKLTKPLPYSLSTVDGWTTSSNVAEITSDWAIQCPTGYITVTQDPAALPTEVYAYWALDTAKTPTAGDTLKFTANSLAFGLE